MRPSAFQVDDFRNGCSWHVPCKARQGVGEEKPYQHVLIGAELYTAQSLSADNELTHEGDGNSFWRAERLP